MDKAASRIRLRDMKGQNVQISFAQKVCQKYEAIRLMLRRLMETIIISLQEFMIN